ncbi:MAG TPA: hypothetical protein VHC47_03785 [Mucilaginibacter sp.]|nr:hypothetical protein [Mucilaginibacter sp.]
MKKLLALCMACFCYIHAYTQGKTNPDSLVYQLQRQKINHMLDERRQKFGQYEESLKKHTGIFGLQTKKDIRRSNAILMDINQEDDSIFDQIRILLSYRVYQQQQTQAQSEQIENNSLGYMTTINRLRDQLKKERNDDHVAETKHQQATRIYVIAIVLMLGSILVLLFIKRSAAT